MKKILLLALCLTTMNCNTTKDPNKEFNGNVKVFKTFEYLATEKFGEPVVDGLLSSYVREYDSDGRTIRIEPDRGNISKYEYNDKGQKVKESLFDKDGELKYVYKHEYNDKGQEIKESSFGKYGDLRHVSKFEYNDKGQKIKDSSFNKDGKLIDVSKFEYNDKGQWVKKSLFNKDGELKSVFKYEYNDKGQKVKDSSFYKQEEVTCVSIFEYNDKGLVVKESNHCNGDIMYLLEYKYTKFDDENNWIERECYKRSEIFTIMKREFIYW